jgi:Ca2+-binding EF-hand superfamily protein
MTDAPTIQRRTEAYKQVFKQFDKNDDDAIDLAEVCGAMGIQLDDARKHIDMNDLDGNGTISFNEFFLLIRNEQKKLKIEAGQMTSAGGKPLKNMM